MWMVEDFWGWVISLIIGIVIVLGIVGTIQLAHANQFIGETPTYAREVGMEARLFYVAGGSDGEGQIEYICKAFAGNGSNDDTSAAVWQVQKFYYNASDVLTRISFAGDDDGYNQSCDGRVSLNYS